MTTGPSTTHTCTRVQAHYPFENKAKFEANFPADFVAEGLDQTRGWFYTLMVLSTALFDKPAFKNLVCNGLVLAADGKKMSKRLQNYPDPVEVRPLVHWQICRRTAGNAFSRQAMRASQRPRVRRRTMHACETLLALGSGCFHSMCVPSPACSSELDGPCAHQHETRMAPAQMSSTNTQKRGLRMCNRVQVVNKYGADALRLYLINSPVVRAEPLRFEEKGVKDVVKTVFLPWYNAFRFLAQNAARAQAECGAFDPRATLAAAPPSNVLDRWIQAAARRCAFRALDLARLTSELIEPPMSRSIRHRAAHISCMQVALQLSLV